MSKENVKKQELQCEIVQDLLPLYHDEVLHEVTHRAVEKHLSGCEPCMKEYRILCEELPKEHDTESKKAITKSKFEEMKKKMKRRQGVKTALISLAACMVLIIIGYVLTQVPLVPVSDELIEVDTVYKVEMEGEIIVFFTYTNPSFDGPLASYFELTESSENGITLEANQKRPVFDHILDDWNPPMMNELVHLEDNNTENIQTITFGGRVIWTEEENGKDEIPEYVYEYAKYFDRPGVSYVSAETYYGIIYEDGREVHWDYEGNVIYEGYISNDEEYDKE